MQIRIQDSVSSKLSLIVNCVLEIPSSAERLFCFKNNVTVIQCDQSTLETKSLCRLKSFHNAGMTFALCLSVLEEIGFN